VNNDSFITELTNKEEFITKIKGIQAYSSISNQSADENAKKVQYAKKFNDGKEGSADVLLTETLTSIERGKEKGKDA
ncbi:hypothetical protein, partial [Myroides injenensis]|uniref:hypothetical protein n=1 Tax=Myroides injenensis TaxID=1183151 RepID=UPI002270EDBD